MATDNEQLVLSISADTRQIQRQLKSLVGQTQANTKAIEAAFDAMGISATGSFDRIAANGNKAFNSAAQSAKRFETAVRQSNAQVANMTYQVQDIGVQLAGGQSPWLIGVQQISQMNLGALGLRGTLSAIGGAAASLISPVNLAALAFVGLGGTAVQYFASLLTESDKSEKALEKQAELIQQVAKEWGDAIPALREYADELERAASISRLREGAGAVIGDIVEDAADDLPRLREEILSVMNSLGGVSREASLGFADLVGKMGEADAALKDLGEAYKSGGDASNELARFNQALSAVLNHEAIPATGALRDFVDQLTNSYARAVQKAGELALAARMAANASAGTYDGVRRTADGPIQNGGFATPEEGPVPESRPRVELEGLPGASGSSRRGGGSRSTSISEADREKEAVKKLIEQLEFERGLIGATNVEREKANALRRAGAAATPEQKARIEELVDAMYAEREALRANKEAMEELGEIGRDALQGLYSDLLNGVSGTDALRSALNRLADSLIDLGFDWLSGGFDFKLPGREKGGPVRKGQPYIVGEKRPELFVPDQNGTIIPKVPDAIRTGQMPRIAAAGSSAGSSTGVRVDVGVSVDRNGNLDAYVRNVSQETVKQGIAQYDKGGAYRTARDLRQVNQRGYAK